MVMLVSGRHPSAQTTGKLTDGSEKNDSPEKGKQMEYC